MHLVLEVQPFLVESRSFETQVASSPLQSSQDSTPIVIWGRSTEPGSHDYVGSNRLLHVFFQDDSRLPGCNL